MPPSNRHHLGCLLEEIQYIWLAECGKIYISFVSKGDNNKCYVKFVFWKVFKNYKTINQSISCNVADFFLLKELSKANWALQRHLGTQGTWAFRHSRHFFSRLLSRLKSFWAIGTTERWLQYITFICHICACNPVIVQTG